MKRERVNLPREVKEIKSLQRELVFSYGTLIIGGQLCASYLFDKVPSLILAGNSNIASAAIITGAFVKLFQASWYRNLSDALVGDHRVLVREKEKYNL